MKRRERVRNAAKARQSFVTHRAEGKLDTLAALMKSAAGERCMRTESQVLRRELFFSGFLYLHSLQLIYNWENRFLSVNYNLQLASWVPVDGTRFQEVGTCRLALRCSQRGLRGRRQYSWQCLQWGGSEEAKQACLERLQAPLLTERLQALDIMEMELRHDGGSDGWYISCESLIGSSTWILIPPVLSMIAPTREECAKFMELFELAADAVVNNR